MIRSYCLIKGKNFLRNSLKKRDIIFNAPKAITQPKYYLVKKVIIDRIKIPPRKKIEKIKIEKKGNTILCDIYTRYVSEISLSVLILFCIIILSRTPTYQQKEVF